jgi:hypothetical protein
MAQLPLRKHGDDDREHKQGEKARKQPGPNFQIRNFHFPASS